MADMKQHKLGWIGIGRMGYTMAESPGAEGENGAYARVAEPATASAGGITQDMSVRFCSIAR
jgi:3-hydroxyisobutyrate dehydrogenase-like beta-hydroxyacid dehydrogenase